MQGGSTNFNFVGNSLQYHPNNSPGLQDQRNQLRENGQVGSQNNGKLQLNLSLPGGQPKIFYSLLPGDKPISGIVFFGVQNQ